MITKETITKKKLGSFNIWAIGVGMVISGESFGWNLGWGITGPLWFFVPVFVAALMYFGLVQSLIELACVYPNVAGPHEYVEKAFGNRAGSFIALAILFEFLFATPAIASSLGEYLGFLINDLPKAPYIGIAFLAVFSLVNLIEIHLGVRLLIILTLLAIVELFLYQGAVVSSFDFQFVEKSPFGTLNFQTFMAAIPYAIWLFLAIEGISLMTKDIDTNNLRKTIGRGYYAAFFTLLILALLVLLLAAGGIDWENPASMSIVEENHPMPASLALILGREHLVVQIFTFIGLFGLIASLQGIALAATQQLATLLPKIELGFFNNRSVASLLVFTLSSAAILISQSGFLIELSVFGAVCMYLAVCLSLLFLRRKTLSNPTEKSNATLYHHSSFNGILSGTSAWVASAIALLSIVAFAQLQFAAFILFIICGVVYVFLKKQK